MRNIVNGVQLADAIYYKFMYAQTDITKESFTALVNI